MVIDATDETAKRDFEIGALSVAGGGRLVDIFLKQIENEPDRPVKSILRNYLNTRADSHQSTHNRLQRDTRSHPNWRLTMELTAMGNDATSLHERVFYMTLFRGGCVDSRDHIRIVGLDEEAIAEPHRNAADRAVIDKVNEFITSIKGGYSNPPTDKG